ncbi:MAG: HAD family hydrolase [Terracoccus sp.]
MISHEPIDTVVLDVDGTLVDSNYQHAIAWFRAFRRYDVTVQIWQVHRALGKGGDLLVAHVAGDEVEAQHGEHLRAAWEEEFEPMRHEVRPLAGVTDLLRSVKRRGVRLVLTSSGKAEHVDALIDLIDGRSVADSWTTSDDVEKSKPDLELLLTALDQVGGRRGLVVGDATWDARAAWRAGLPAVAVLTGASPIMSCAMPVPSTSSTRSTTCAKPSNVARSMPSASARPSRHGAPVR